MVAALNSVLAGALASDVAVLLHFGAALPLPDREVLRLNRLRYDQGRVSALVSSRIELRMD